MRWGKGKDTDCPVSWGLSLWAVWDVRPQLSRTELFTAVFAGTQNNRTTAGVLQIIELSADAGRLLFRQQHIAAFGGRALLWFG
jgi:hypothetical protein